MGAHISTNTIVTNNVNKIKYLSLLPEESLHKIDKENSHAKKEF